MGNFPFFGFPYNRYYYNNYRGTYPHFNNNSNTNSVSFATMKNEAKSLEHVDNFSNSVNSTDSTNLTDSTNNKNSENRKISSNIDEPIFEILGISLYLDDIIILCLLFFLYTEGVQDELLFIVLILLLLS